MNPIRQQLTLFVPDEESGAIEALREVLDPVQHALIRAHVTLCREDELAAAGDFAARLRRSTPGCLGLRFGRPERSEGHGVVVPCVRGGRAFQRVRRFILGSPSARSAPPHITLAHPRNPRAPGNPEGPVGHLLPGVSFTFATVSLIEQAGSSPWRVLATFPLPVVEAASDV